MSIPRPEQDGLGAEQLPKTPDPFGTDLISRIANEFFGRSVGGTDLPAGPLAPRGAPQAVAGLPSQSLPVIPTSYPSAPEVPSGGEGLSGGYPTPSPSTPPVHPVLKSSSSPGAGRTAPSVGAHDLNCGDSHPFGEPHSNVCAFSSPAASHDSHRSQARVAPASRDLGEANALFAGQEAFATPDFYFLERRESASAQARTSATGFDVEAIRRDFPILHQKVNGHPLVWFDNAATTQKPRQVIDATSEFYERDNSNIHRAAYALAERSTKLFEAGREKVRQFLGAKDAKEIVFLRGTTEAINLVAQSYGRQNVGAGDEIVLTELEHHANIVPWQILAEQVGATIRVIPINDRGELRLEEFVKLLSPRTKIVSVAHVSNSLGTINPIEEIIGLAHARGAKVLVDGAQSTPHFPVNVTALDADFYVFSGHKVFGPTGIGALYGKADLLEAMPPWQGGGHMIRDVTFEKTIYQHAPEKFEAGTPDIAGVVGLGAAIDYLTQLNLPTLSAYEHSLLEYATQALESIPGIRFIGTALNKASVLSFVIRDVPNEQIARHLDRHGIAVRAGHHCALPAHRHFGLESTVRASLAFYNTRAEVDTLVRALCTLPRS